MPAHCSIKHVMRVKSALSPKAARVMLSTWRTLLPTGIGTPIASASSRQRRVSFRDSAVVNPKSNVRGRTARGSLSAVALLRALPALKTSSMTWGSSPAFTPMTSASQETAKAVTETRLFTSFIVWPSPGASPQNSGFPMFLRIGSSSS
ncbi:hypothetical protein D3C84_989180 [compost metagenome]